MKVISPSFSVIVESDDFTPAKIIESIARVCYKSEDRICDGSAERMIQALVNKGHMTMLEHYRFIVRIPDNAYGILRSTNPKYLVLSRDNGGSDRFDEYCVVSGSPRALIELLYWCYDHRHPAADVVRGIIRCISRHGNNKILFPDERSVFLGNDDRCHYGYQLISRHDLDKLGKEHMVHDWMSVKFICDRGVSHELVRHRDASFAQESTRYCNYKNGGYTFIKPLFFEPGTPEYDAWETACMQSAHHYDYLISIGQTPECARTVLNNSIKTEIVVTATMTEWHHIFRLRVEGVTGKPHPQMVELLEPLYDNVWLRLV